MQSVKAFFQHQKNKSHLGGSAVAGQAIEASHAIGTTGQKTRFYKKWHAEIQHWFDAFDITKRGGYVGYR